MTGTRVGTRQNERDLTDHAVEDLLALLDQLVGVDRELVDVLVLDEGLAVLTLRRRVEEAVGVDALVPGLEDRVTQNVVGAVVAVLPDERNRHLVLVLEGLRHDGPTIRALETSLSRPTAEIGFHYAVSFLLIDCCCWSCSCRSHPDGRSRRRIQGRVKRRVLGWIELPEFRLWHVAVPELIGLRVLRRA
jgi:hypothetical protein